MEVATRRTPELQIAILRRISDKPGEDYHGISSYLERQPNSVRAALSRLHRKALIEKVGDCYYPYGWTVAPKLAPQTKSLGFFWYAARTIRYWVPAGMILGSIAAYLIGRYV